MEFFIILVWYTIGVIGIKKVVMSFNKKAKLDYDVADTVAVYTGALIGPFGILAYYLVTEHLLKTFNDD